jgi:hypothetical protein
MTASGEIYPSGYADESGYPDGNGILNEDIAADSSNAAVDVGLDECLDADDRDETN